MLEFKINDTTASIVVTLTELVGLPDPYYLFVFQHVTTKSIVATIKHDGEDISAYPPRYNEFIINPAELFDNQPTGEWHYKIYEQASNTNTDPLLADGLLEQGKLLLQPAVEFTRPQYHEETGFITYNG